ncbi:hypothetical protein TNCV_1802121 [Trichonephila clavipes]|nr:hypothetical protein TNCV_1802121 [Trichonephila clavipes]
MLTDLVILSHGQVTRTTPELIPYHTKGRKSDRLSDSSVSFLYTVDLYWYWARTQDKPVTIRYLDQTTDT